MHRLTGFLAALTMSWSAVAVECPAIEGGSTVLAAEDAQARLSFLRAEMLWDRAHARVWKKGWLFGFSVALVGQMAVTPALPYDQRWTYYIGSIKTALGIGSILLTPLHSVRDGRDFDLRLLHASPTEDPCALLREGELLLLRDAKEERDGHGVFAQVSAALLNIAGGLVLGLGFHQWVNAVVSLGTSTIVGEIMVLTRPTAAEGALERYRAGVLKEDPISVHVEGLSLVGKF